MVTEAQAAHVIELVRERHTAVRQAFESLLNAYANGDQNQIIAANERLKTAIQQLQGVVAAKHLPAWLQDVSANVDRYAANHNQGLPVWRAHLDSALRNAQALNSETWSFSEREEILFDIDAIVEKARQEHNIHALYEKVIECLNALLRSGEIDSIKAATDLAHLIATLKQASSGSFSSQVFSWRFARRLVPNIISAYAKRNDITGPLIEAFEQTASELDISLEAAKDQVGEDILTAATEALRTNTSAGITQEAILFLEHDGSAELTAAVDADSAAA